MRQRWRKPTLSHFLLIVTSLFIFCYALFVKLFYNILNPFVYD